MQLTFRKVILPIDLPQESAPSVKGTGAYDYIHRVRNIQDIESDPRYLGAMRQPDGVLLVFHDGSTALLAMRLEDETEAEFDKRLMDFSTAINRGDEDALFACRAAIMNEQC